MGRHEVKIKMPLTLEDGKRMHEDMERLEGKASARYYMWVKHYENDALNYSGGFDISFIFYDEQKAHQFNNLWDIDQSGAIDE